MELRVGDVFENSFGGEYKLLSKSGRKAIIRNGFRTEEISTARIIAMIKSGDLIQYRPTPEGLVQVWPEVNDAS